MMRLDKYLCEMNVGSRSEVKKYIRQGRITVDGKTAVKPEEKICKKIHSLSPFKYRKRH